jgi:catechol 2,3-dioxygenase-like lactoylglutathione lyase family enzyme
MHGIFFVNTIVFVKDIPASTQFYSRVLGLKIMNSYETIVWFENNFTIHDAGALYKTIYKKESPSASAPQGKDNVDIYFECTDLKAVYNRLREHNVEFIHGIEKQAWGQTVIRFYDPDRHIIEIGEPFRVDFNGEKPVIGY